MIIASLELGFENIEHTGFHNLHTVVHLCTSQTACTVCFFFGEWFLCFVESWTITHCFVMHAQCISLWQRKTCHVMSTSCVCGNISPEAFSPLDALVYVFFPSFSSPQRVVVLFPNTFSGHNTGRSQFWRLWDNKSVACFIPKLALKTMAMGKDGCRQQKTVVNVGREMFTENRNGN